MRSHVVKDPPQVIHCFLSLRANNQGSVEQFTGRFKVAFDIPQFAECYQRIKMNRIGCKNLSNDENKLLFIPSLKRNITS